MKLLRDWVLPNWWLKLLALAISFLLWATYTAEPFIEVGYAVPLEYRNLPAGLEISGEVPTQVHVRAQGRSALLRRLAPADLNLSVDLSGARQGVALLRLTPAQVSAPYGVKVVDVSPPQVRVLLTPPHPAP